MRQSVVAVVGLGYVGLPLAVEFGKRFSTLGYDVSRVTLERWDDLPRGDALVLAVPHRDYLRRSTAELVDKVTSDGCVIDVKSVLDLAAIHRSGRACWRL